MLTAAEARVLANQNYEKMSDAEFQKHQSYIETRMKHALEEGFSTIHIDDDFKYYYTKQRLVDWLTSLGYKTKTVFIRDTHKKKIEISCY
jgi:hypothetical protein